MLLRLLLSLALAADQPAGAIVDRYCYDGWRRHRHDPGSVVPGAKITVTNPDAGFVFTSITTSGGYVVHPEPEPRHIPA